MLRSLLSVSKVSSSLVGVRCFAVGSVKWFNNTKGFGFIQGDDNVDVFVHQSNIKSNTFRMLEEGERVKFDIEKSERGPQATNVTREDGSPLDRAPLSRDGGGGGGGGGGGDRGDRGDRRPRERRE